MSPHPVDLHVGKQLRKQRIIMGMSQEALAGAVGITFQQVQKYERGVNRMSSSRLFEFARVLNVQVSYFFEGLEESANAANSNNQGANSNSSNHGANYGVAESDAPEFVSENTYTRESLELMRCFHRLKNPQVKRRILELTRAVADEKFLLGEDAPTP